jgi:hypothetical protein
MDDVRLKAANVAQCLHEVLESIEALREEGPTTRR